MVLTEEFIYKRLRQVGNTQESIGTLTTWVFHHQDKLDMIVECWLNSFRTANDDLRISLFYLMNDVVQKSIQKEQNKFALIFQPAIISAIKLGRANDKVYTAMEKVLKIFESRKIYAGDVMTNMMARLTNDDEVIDMDVLDVKAKIEAFERAHQCFEKGCAVIKKGKFKYDELVPVRMRTRPEGKVLRDQCNDVVHKIDSFIEAAQIRHQRSIELVELLELSIRYFGSELRDANTAEDAYQQFHKGMVEVKCDLERMIGTGTYPGATPPKDAPSPTPQDDIYVHGVEEVLNSMRAMQRDNTEVADMEIGDDESAPRPLGPAIPISMHARMYDHRQLASTSKSMSSPFTSGTDPRKLGQMPLLPPGIPKMIPSLPPPPLMPKSEESVEERPTQPLSLRNRPLTFENIRGLLEKVKATNPSSPPSAQKHEKEPPMASPLSVKAQELLPPGVSPSMISPTIPPPISSDAMMNAPGTSNWLPNRDFSMPPPPVPFKNGSLTQPPQQFYSQPPPILPPGLPTQIPIPPGRSFSTKGDQDLRAVSNEATTSFDNANDKRFYPAQHSFAGEQRPSQHLTGAGNSMGEQYQNPNSKIYLPKMEPYDPNQERSSHDSADKHYPHQQQHSRYGENQHRGRYRNDGFRGRAQNYGQQRGGQRGEYHRGGQNRDQQNDYNRTESIADRDRKNNYNHHQGGSDDGYKRRRDSDEDGYSRGNYKAHGMRGSRQGYRGGFSNDRGNFKDRRNYDATHSRDRNEPMEKN